MIVTIIRTFSDTKKNKKFVRGDIHDVSAADFTRYTAKPNRPFVVKGRQEIKGGACHPCIKKKQLKRGKNNG